MKNQKNSIISEEWMYSTPEESKGAIVELRVIGGFFKNLIFLGKFLFFVIFLNLKENRKI